MTATALEQDDAKRDAMEAEFIETLRQIRTLIQKANALGEPLNYCDDDQMDEYDVIVSADMLAADIDLLLGE